MYRAGLPVLGARLLAAAGLVAPGKVVADIGCDHGKLAVWLACRGISPRVIAVDNRPMPLQKAKALVRQAGCEQTVDCRLGNGLAALGEGEAQEVIVAGLSGETIVGILSAHGWLRAKGVHLVLLPVTRAARLRRWLCQNGFSIEKEALALENGRCYAAMSARYTGKAHRPEELFCQVGLVPEGEPEAARVYLNARLKDLKKRALAPMDEAQRKDHEKLTQEVEACLP